MIRSKRGEMTFNARQVAILLISAVSIAGVTFAIGYLSGSFTKNKETEKPQAESKPDEDIPAAPGAITKKLDTDAILKERVLPIKSCISQAKIQRKRPHSSESDTRILFKHRPRKNTLWHRGCGADVGHVRCRHGNRICLESERH